MKTPYDSYNREERSLCNHLFRLLHEPSREKRRAPLATVLDHLRGLPLEWNGPARPLPQLEDGRAAIFTEVALVRDAYKACRDLDAKQGPPASRKETKTGFFMDGLVEWIRDRSRASDCPLWTDLVGDVADPSKTHPRQIAQKVAEVNACVGKEFYEVYGRVQAYFNAKPDLAIVLPEHLIVIEAKLTESFDDDQMKRTREIAALWASPVLRGELGFESEPTWTVIKLGAEKDRPAISWEWLTAQVVAETWEPTDRSRIAFDAAAALLAEANRKHAGR